MKPEISLTRKMINKFNEITTDNFFTLFDRAKREEL